MREEGTCVYLWLIHALVQRKHSTVKQLRAMLSRARLFAAPWTVARKALCPWGFSRQEYWSGLPCPPPGDLPNPGIERGSPALQADSLPAELPGKPSKPIILQTKNKPTRVQEEPMEGKGNPVHQDAHQEIKISPNPWNQRHSGNTRSSGVKPGIKS